MKENELVAIRNVQAYLEAIGKSHKWVCQRANIFEEHFLKFLNGEGHTEEVVTKISKLFRINDSSYFYSIDSKLPRNLEQLEMNSFQNLQSTTNFHLKDSQELQETMRILDDVINIIHVLKTAKEIG